MKDKDFNQNAITAKYVIRKTEEEVEVIAYNCNDEGARSETDWVTYIDSKGEEHIKENLHIKLDFKLSAELPDYFKKLFNSSSFSSIKYPSVYNTRYYEIVKDLVIEKGHDIEIAKKTAKSIVDATKNKYKEKDG